VETQFPTYRSDLGNQVAIKSKAMGLRAMACVIYNNPETPNKFQVSLRSLDTEDTTEIAKKYGGGGHLNASGLSLDKKLFESWKIQNKKQKTHE